MAVVVLQQEQDRAGVAVRASEQQTRFGAPVPIPAGLVPGLDVESSDDARGAPVDRVAPELGARLQPVPSQRGRVDRDDARAAEIQLPAVARVTARPAQKPEVLPEPDGGDVESPRGGVPALPGGVEAWLLLVGQGWREQVPRREAHRFPSRGWAQPFGPGPPPS